MSYYFIIFHHMSALVFLFPGVTVISDERSAQCHRGCQLPAPPTPRRENPFVPYPPPQKKGESHKFLKNHLAKPPQRVAENL